MKKDAKRRKHFDTPGLVTVTWWRRRLHFPGFVPGWPIIDKPLETEMSNNGRIPLKTWCKDGLLICTMKKTKKKM